MAKEGGKLLIKYRDPVAASFSSKDVVMNVQQEPFSIKEIESCMP